MSYHPAKFGGHRHSGGRDITIFVCEVTLQDHIIRALCDFMVRIPLRSVTILPSFVAIDTVVVEI